ncbi:unnamed protein product, partial [Ixodes pacificus]
MRDEMTDAYMQRPQLIFFFFFLFSKDVAKWEKEGSRRGGTSRKWGDGRKNRDAAEGSADERARWGAKRREKKPEQHALCWHCMYTLGRCPPSPPHFAGEGPNEWDEGEEGHTGSLLPPPSPINKKPKRKKNNKNTDSSLK